MLEHCKIQGIEYDNQSQLRWAGHTVCMDDTRIPKLFFYGELKEGYRNRGGQRKRHKYVFSLKANLKSWKIKPGTWEATTCNRTAWRGLWSKGLTAFEEGRIQ